MKASRALRKVVLGAVVLVAAVAAIVNPAGTPVTRPEPPHRLRLVIKTAILTLVAAGVLFVLGSLVFIESGWYNLAADTPHFLLTRWMLLTMRDRAVRFHSGGTAIPDLGGLSLSANGFSFYRKNCQPCHGAPGEPGEQIGRGINPKPPRLATTVNRWTDSQLYWIISHGLKMSGMPAFAARLSDADRWAIVSFLRRMVWFSPADYKRMAAEVDQGIKPVDWPSGNDAAFDRLDRANPQRGRDLMQSYGCASCHESPGIGPGYVGPPLVGFAERQYIAGMLVNVPSKAVAWIMNPKRFKPATAMPNLGVTSGDAFDIAAWLYTSGDPKRINALRHPEELHR